MSEQAPASIPKFASFRPKPVPTSTPSSVDVTLKEDRRLSKEEEAPRRKDEQKLHHRHHHRCRSRERHREREVLHVGKEDSLQSPETSEIFVVDRKGDVKNLIYGSIHRYSVPPFHRTGAGAVLGTNSDVKIDRDYGDEKGIVLTNRKESKLNSREKYVFSKVEKERPRLLKIRPELIVGDTENQDADFIPLQVSRGRKRKRPSSDSEERSDSEQDGTPYRSIHGKAKASNRPSDENLQYATESDSSGSDAGRTIRLDNVVKQRSIELSRKVERFPRDADAWLALIEHQDTLLRQGDDHRRITNAEIKSTADIKIHMYEKALRNSNILKDRERLLLGLMAEGAKIWDFKTQSDRWEQISKDNIDSLVLWTSYVNFKQSAFSNFRYEEVRDVYMQRIRHLLTSMSEADPEKIESLCLQFLYVLLRFTFFVRESGYSELALAIWQGLLELNFCAPPQTLSLKDAIEAFQEFWETELPRIGESGALGWQQYVASLDDSTVPDAQVDDTESSYRAVDIFENWASVERMRTLASRKPARTMDEVAEDDPYRVILFSDIKPFLVRLPSSSDRLRRSLLDAFLLFSHLPPMAVLDQEKPNFWLTDSFIRGELLDCDTAWIKYNYLSSKTYDPEGEGKEKEIITILNPGVLQFSSSSESMFGRIWFKSMVSWRELYAGDNGPLSYDWVRGTLKQLIQSNFTENLAEYYLAFEWINEPDTIKKVSKHLLKQHPSCIRLYNAYAMIEWSKGNKEVAVGVFSAALGMSSSIREEERKDFILLWKTWIWACLEDLDNAAALEHLLSIADGKPNDSAVSTAAVLLRTRQYLSSTLEHLLSSGHPSHAVLFVECLALFEYLTSISSAEPQSSSQGNITSALSVYTSASHAMISRKLTQTASHELLLQSATRLLFHHVRVGPFRPALLRDQLSRFLSFFPQNTILLSLYTWNESRLRIDARVRSLLTSTILTPQNDSLTSRLFAIRYEIISGTVHSVRSAFENAVSSPVCKFSASLWRFYVLWSCWTAQAGTPKEMEKAKEVWYRAIRACPWVKELYMLGMTVLREYGIIENREVREVGRILGEKELRVHVDLEETLEEWDSLQREAIVRRE